MSDEISRRNLLKLSGLALGSATLNGCGFFDANASTTPAADTNSLFNSSILLMASAPSGECAPPSSYSHHVAD